MKNYYSKKYLVGLLLLLFVVVSCKKELTVEQAKLKVKFEEDVHNMEVFSSAINSIIIKMAGNLISYDSSMIYRNDENYYIRAKYYHYVNETVTNLNAYNSLAKDFNKSYNSAKRLKKILEETGVTVNYSYYSNNIENYLLVNHDISSFTHLAQKIISGEFRKLVSSADINTIVLFRNKLNDKTYTEIFCKDVLYQIFLI